VRKAGWELSTYSLRDSGDIELANALAADKGWLRKDLASGMHDALNQNEFYAPGVGVYDCLKLFEVGHVFTIVNGKRKESTHVCIGARYLTGKKREEKTNALLLDMRAKLQDALGIHIDHRLDAETLEFNLGLAIVGKEFTSLALLPVVPYMRYTPLSHFPVALRDVAFWDTRTADIQTTDPLAALADRQQTLKNIIRAAAGPLLHRIDLFDTFSKEGKTSYAFHLGFQSYEKTLTDETLVPTMQAVYEALKVAGCEIR
jgi:phenylalanyl-tRNA synthetase beta subunit